MMVVFQSIQWLLRLIIVLLAAGVYFMFRKMSAEKDEKQLVKSKKNLGFNEKSRLQKRLFMNSQKKYDQTAVFLSEYGVNYMMKRIVDPVEWRIANILMGIVCAFIGCTLIQSPLGIVAFLPGLYILKYTIKLSDDADNKVIMKDIKNVYDTLKIKTEGGMFLTNALAECYRVVENRRLKSAMMTLTSEILLKNDILSTIDEFNIKFHNKYIDTFCIIIRQSLESGQSVQVLNDVSNQMVDVQKALEQKMKEKLDMQISIIQLLLYVGILGICVYAAICSLGSSFAFF